MRNDLCPFLDLVAEKLGGIVRRTPKHEPSHISKRALYFRISKGRIELHVEDIDHARGSGCGCGKTRPGVCLITRNKLSDSRHLRQRRPTRRGCDRKRTELSRPDMLDRGRHGREIDLHLTCEKLAQRGWRATIRHVDEVERGHHLEQLAGKMPRAARASRSHIELPRIGLGIW